MADVPVRQVDFDWRIKPPGTVKIGHTLTVVGRIPGVIELQVLEAIVLDQESGSHAERIDGQGVYTNRGFNNDSHEHTYVWFFVRLDKRGMNRIKFRISWQKGRELLGATETFEVRVGDSYESPFYGKLEIYCPGDEPL
ncbi:hypothetical protein F5Y08DRAFT_310871 [Xylaria arbuscula]|nr:hypothetical protein F5Y08DRAFT_310871 [Xylaria arbuscula]